MGVPASPDFVAALLGAEPAERERLLGAAETSELEGALAELGHTREPAAAEVLALVDLVVEDRALRKLARRELHRLRSMGIEPPPSLAAAGPAQARSAEAPLEVAEAWATDIDPSGSRALWLLAERRLGGIWFAALLLNDLHGLQDLSLVDTTRKRFRREFEESRRTGAWVRLPGAYALRLVREAVDLTREQGGGLPTRYHSFHDVFGEAPGPPERALVYETVSPVEANFHPEWLDESPHLVTEPEMRGWYVSMPAELRARALEVARATSAGLLVPGHAPEQLALQLLADAAREGLTPPVRRAFRRRLEETAYIFLDTDRLDAARRAVAAARPLDDSHFVAERHPLLRMFLAAGLARLTGAEQVGSRGAAEVLLQLMERVTERGPEEGPLETRPSGLILPR